MDRIGLLDMAGGRNALGQPDIACNDRSAPDDYPAQNGGACIDDDIVFDDRMARYATVYQALIIHGDQSRAKRHALIQTNTVADNRRFADHDPIAMIDKETLADRGAGTRVMDGQALALDDGSFDAVFSIFGVIIFPDWRKGLAEMARVTRIGGTGVVATWQDRGAATFLLLGQIRRKLFPDREGMTMPDAVKALSDPADFANELVLAGYRDPRIEEVTYDYPLDMTLLVDPDTLFGMSPDWTSLSDVEKVAVIAEVRAMASDRAILPIPSTALIAVARR